MSHCHDCPHRSDTATRAYCCMDKARERDKYERLQDARIYEAVRDIPLPAPNRAERRRQAAIRRKG